MKLDLTKAKEILSLLQEDTITPKQAKELVTLLVQLTEKQKQDLILRNEDFLSKVSRETFTQIQNALIEIKEKAHDNQLEVRQLTNKQKKSHESKMAQLEALIEEFRNFEIPEIDKEGIIQETLSRIPEVKEYKLLGENVVDSINALEVTPENQIDAKHIKNLPQSVNNIVTGAGGRLLSQMNDVDITGLAQDKVLKWDATRNIWVTGTTSGSGAVDSVNGQTGVVVLTKSDIGLGNIDNTSDVNKPISTATQTALDGKVDENVAITGATKTKITYDAKGLVTSGADATTADIADSSNKRYVTDAQLTVIGNTSGTNTGDNATNTQYSGLAASKQDTLVSGTNIKTINSTSILGSGNITTGDVSTGGSYADPSWITSLGWSKISTTPTTLSGYGITDAQPLDTQLTSLAGLSYTGNALKVVRVNAGETDFELATLTGGGDALTSNPLSQFASTTSAQLKGVMSDETGSGKLVFATSPFLTTPSIESFDFLNSTITSFDDSFTVKNSAGGTMFLFYGNGLAADAGVQFYGDTALNMYSAGTATDININLIPKGVGVIGNSGQLNLVTGTTTKAPIKFTSGTNLSTATAGAMEYDGRVLYSTPVANARGVSPSVMYAILDSAFNLQTAAGVQSAFPSGYDVWTLEGSTTYYVEGFYYITKATTALTTAIAFALGGGASITSMRLEVISTHAAVNTTATANNSTIVDRVASTVVTASSAANAMISFRGHIRMNAGGTVTPQINWSTTATATPTMAANSYIKFTPIGTNTMTSVGNVA